MTKTPTTKKPKKKTPKVWVSFGGGVDWQVHATRPKYAEAYRYAHVQPPKACRWTDDGGEEWAWHPACNPNAVQRDADKFCPNCGGRIKVAK